MSSLSILFVEEDVRIVISPESTSVDEGNTVILTCVGYGVPYAAISWEREGVGLTNDSRITIYEEPLTEGGVTFTKSILEICSAQVSDTGSYSCIADNGVSNDTVLFDVTILPVGGKRTCVDVCKFVIVTAYYATRYNCIDFLLQNQLRL